MVIGKSGFEAQPGPIIVSGYSGVCFEIKLSGRHRGFDGVLCHRLVTAEFEFIEIKRKIAILYSKILSLILRKHLVI